MVVYSLGMTFYWCVDYHLPQNQVLSSLFYCLLKPIHSVIVIGTCTSFTWLSPVFLPASPPECGAGGFTAEHVRGHAGQADRPADSAGCLRASPQGLIAASC